MRHPTAKWLAAMFVGCAALLAVLAQAGIATTKHNLSASGPGTFKAATEPQVCIFCHTPHNSAPSGPLWNRGQPGSAYVPYTSSTQRATAGQPTGASLLCLSCHDGTIALGDVLTRRAPIRMAGGATTLPAGASRIGTDLSDDHPVSFAYTAALAAANGELVNPATLTGRVRLDGNGQMQCTSCHDAHDDTNRKFLVLPNVGSVLCEACHVKNYWTASDHRTSPATWNGALPNPWPHTEQTTVAANACENCHQPHAAPGKPRLLHAEREEDNCLACHNGNVAARNLRPEFSKASVHGVDATTGVHDPVEPGVVQKRHVECVDCHNPHAAKAGAAIPSGALTGVRGIALAGGEVKPSSWEYQICFRCHADSPGQPAPRITRQIAQINTRLEFDRANPSFHPVAGPGVNPNMPSLIPPLTPASVIKCTDCHNNNAGPGAGGGGPNGPHGSTYTPLLERQYLTAHPTTESPAAYALCYKCHSRTSILASESFGGGGHEAHHGHWLHIVMLRAPCSTCHDAHGVSATQGDPINNSKLINFDTTVVKPTPGGVLKFESLGTFKGRCYLVCHGAVHNPLSYGMGEMEGGEMMGTGAMPQGAAAARGGK